ncbi:MAG: sigma-70 family RNA polymerase sigma factor [Planctomycetota bacterium]
MIQSHPEENDPAPEPETSEGLGRFLEQNRARLRRMVELRLDRRVRGRVDASDVLQEAFIEVSTRVPQYLEKPDVPFYVWVRFITAQKIQEFHRRHLGRQNRDVRREVRLGTAPEASSIALAEAFLDDGPSPSQVAMEQENWRRLLNALEGLKPVDREVVAMRHFEGLRNVDVAEILGLSKPGASVRYVRAMQRLGAALQEAS